MKTKLNLMKKLMLFTAAVAFCVALVAKPVDVEAASTAPTNVKQIAADTSRIAISWTSNTSSKHEVQLFEDGAWWSLTKSATTSGTITGLNAATTYQIRVGVVNSGEWVTITADTAPDYRTTVTQTSADLQSVTVTWAPVTGATGYSVYYGASTNFDTARFVMNTANKAATIAGLPKNSKYCIFVVPYRCNNNTSKFLASSGYSGKSSCVTLPTAPSVIDIYSTKRSLKTITYQWAPSSVWDNTDGYQVEVWGAKNKKGSMKLLGSATTSSYLSTSASLKNSKLFSAGSKYRVRAYVKINNTVLYGPWTAFKYYVPSAYAKKLTPVSSSSAKLKWSKVTGATSYSIYWKAKESGKWKRVKKNVKGTSATVKYKGSSYYNYYYVMANKVKLDKKKYTSVNPNKKAAYSFTEFKKRYYW